MRLDISDNPMTSEIAADLAETLRRQAGLRALNLNDTRRGGEGGVDAWAGRQAGAPGVRAALFKRCNAAAAAAVRGIGAAPALAETAQVAYPLQVRGALAAAVWGMRA